MKKMMKMAIAATMVMTMSANAMASEVKEESPMEMAETITSIQAGPSYETRTVIYDMGDYTNIFEYTIDQNGIVLSKTQYRSNHNDYKKVPVCTYNVTYGEVFNQITFATWNEEEQSFTKDVKTTTYNSYDCPVLFLLPDIINY